MLQPPPKASSFGGDTQIDPPLLCVPEISTAVNNDGEITSGNLDNELEKSLFIQSERNGSFVTEMTVPPVRMCGPTPLSWGRSCFQSWG